MFVRIGVVYPIAQGFSKIMNNGLYICAVLMCMLFREDTNQRIQCLVGADIE